MSRNGKRYFHIACSALDVIGKIADVQFQRIVLVERNKETCVFYNAAVLVRGYFDLSASAFLCNCGVSAEEYAV